MDNTVETAIALFVLACVLALWVISVYNTVVNLQGQVKRAWGNVDVVLKQRWDLVPNLVNTVKGYASHEKDVFEQITRLRSEALGARDSTSRIDAEVKAGRLFGSMMGYFEQYP